MIKPKYYKGGDLKGRWLFTLKLDGVRMLRDVLGNPVSRAGKPLHNLQEIPAHIKDAEVYLGTWEATSSAVRTHNGTPIEENCVYSIEPLDPRLIIRNYDYPCEEFINTYLAKVNALGYEGLVLYDTLGNALKVKPEETFDLTIIDIIEGKGKRAGCVGKMVTNKGNVGIFKGFTETDLAHIWANRYDYIGTVGEFACMQLTPFGKMRHGKLLRLRFDKSNTE